MTASRRALLATTNSLSRIHDGRGFASSGFWEEHDCAVASLSAADPLHCGHIDVRPREQLGARNGTDHRG
jgi:hypothetical protein